MLGLGQSPIKGNDHNTLGEVKLILFQILNITMSMNSYWSRGLLQIVATYTTTAGETKTSLLLTSGW